MPAERQTGMKTLANLFENNKKWVESIEKNEPGFFKQLSHQQEPEYLWIGCSDSRVPANNIVGLQPGELFVHRNIANLVLHSDMNCLSVMQYAVDVLNVKHIIVCGHYGCGGVTAAIDGKPHGLVDNWTRVIKEVYLHNYDELKNIDDQKELIDRLCELNVMNQVYNVCSTSVIRDAWEKGQNINIHGWIYAIENGLLKDMGITVSSKDEFEKMAAKKLFKN